MEPTPAGPPSPPRLSPRAAAPDPAAFLAALAGTESTGIVVLDRDLRFRLWNAYQERLTGIPAADVLGRYCYDVFPGLRDGPLALVHDRALAGETVRSADVPYPALEDGEPRWADAVHFPYLDAAGEVTGIVAVVHDVTDRRSLEERLLHDARHDALTGLPNRLFFLERLRHACVRRPKRGLFAVLFLDLDRFKVVNDSLGHGVGDELLVEVARRLAASVREADTVARFGGDEFAVLLEDVDGLPDATRVAERIRAAVGAPMLLAGQDMVTVPSIGIVLGTPAAEDPAEVLRNADMAMYRAKASGLVPYEIFDRQMHAEALHRLRLESDLRRALDRGELELHYQPMFAVDTRRVTGLEALLRWRRGEDLMAPGEFIPVAEETRLIFPIGEWVMREAMERLREWQDRFPRAEPLTMSVNLSGQQFLGPGLAELVHGAMRDAGVRAGTVRLDVTEGMIGEDPGNATRVLRELRRLGVRLHLDDFGTGFSSLDWLHDLPLDALKIDRTFVGRIGRASQRPQVLHTIVALAENLGIEAIPEGVETETQLAEVGALGCRFAQGFLVSRAVPGEAVGAILARESLS